MIGYILGIATGYLAGHFFGWNKGFRVGTDDERARWKWVVEERLR